MRDIWEDHGKSGVTEETDDSREDQKWGRRRGLLSFLALLATVGCDSSSSNRGGGYHPADYYGRYDYYGRNNYHRSPRRRYRYRRRRA
jgi:hypothetical protein